MKYVIATASILASIATTVAAEETVRARITYVEPRYETVYQNNPRRQCNDVEVPVYGTVQGNGASSGDILGGMIVGGLLGKGATGNDRGAAAGAVLGGMIAADNNRGRQVITGYRIEQQCREVMVREEKRQLKNYYIQFEWNGVTGQAYTFNNYSVGDRLNATVNISAQ